MDTSLLTRAALAVAGVIAASAALAAPAHAALVATTTDCAASEISRPFTAWGDAHDYKLVGAFEDGGAGWTLTGGARVVAGNEPAKVHAATDANSLLVPAGATVVSPPVCAGHDDPTLRFFGKGSNLLASVAVSVQVTLVGGVVVTVPIGTDAGLAWAPSSPLALIANHLPPAGEYTAVRLIFTAMLGDWQLDDVYVDPRSKF